MFKKSSLWKSFVESLWKLFYGDFFLWTFVVEKKVLNLFFSLRKLFVENFFSSNGCNANQMDQPITVNGAWSTSRLNRINVIGCSSCSLYINIYQIMIINISSKEVSLWKSFVEKKSELFSPCEDHLRKILDFFYKGFLQTI